MTFLLNLFQKYNIALILSLILILPLIPHVDAFSQTGVDAIVRIQPGESFTYKWGLNSDVPDQTIVVSLSAKGEAADVISFPEFVELLPGQWNEVDLVVTIPDDHPNDVLLTGDVFALMRGKGEGSTIFNVQMQKPFKIFIGNPVIEEAAAQEKPTMEMDDERVQQLQEENQKLLELLEQQKAEEETPQPQPAVTESQEEGGGCLISTATYGSELAPQVQMLREIRDNSLLTTSSGSAFMTGFNTLYYSFSPTIADWERQSPIFQEAVKITITPLITSLSILNYVDMDSEAEVLGYGIGIILLNIGMYFVAPAVLIIRLKR